MRPTHTPINSQATEGDVCISRQIHVLRGDKKVAQSAFFVGRASNIMSGFSTIKGRTLQVEGRCRQCSFTECRVELLAEF